MRKLGGSASINELVDVIIDGLALPDEVADVPHGDDGRLTEVEYRAAWARTYLKKAGLVDNSGRGVWALTAEGSEIEKVDPKRLVREVRRERRKRRQQKRTDEDKLPEEDVEESWETQLLSILGSMDPIAFERLCQRLLRESGFTEVEVTRRSGDGGIDVAGRPHRRVFGAPTRRPCQIVVALGILNVWREARSGLHEARPSTHTALLLPRSPGNLATGPG